MSGSPWATWISGVHRLWTGLWNGVSVERGEHIGVVLRVTHHENLRPALHFLFSSQVEVLHV